jgi:hypothetical protein
VVIFGMDHLDCQIRTIAFRVDFILLAGDATGIPRRIPFVDV